MWTIAGLPCLGRVPSRDFDPRSRARCPEGHVTSMTGPHHPRTQSARLFAEGCSIVLMPVWMQFGGGGGSRCGPGPKLLGQAPDQWPDLAWVPGLGTHGRAAQRLTRMIHVEMKCGVLGRQALDFGSSLFPGFLPSRSNCVTGALGCHASPFGGAARCHPSSIPAVRTRLRTIIQSSEQVCFESERPRYPDRTISSSVSGGR